MDPDQIASLYEERFTQPDVLKADPGMGKVHTDDIDAMPDKQQFAGDVATRDYAKHVGGLYEQGLRAKGFQPDPEKRQALEDAVHQKARQYAIDTYAERMKGSVGIGRSYENAFGKLPFVGSGMGLAKAVVKKHISDPRFASDTATSSDYLEAGQRLAEARHEESLKGSWAGRGERALDLATGLPATMAEWMAGNPAGAVGRGLAESGIARLAPKLAGGFAGRAAGAAGEGLARTATMSTPAIAAAGIEGGAGEAGKATVSHALTNSLFSLGGVFKLPENKPILKHFIEGMQGVGAFALNEAVQKGTGLQPGGLDWKDLLTDSTVIGALEAVLHTAGHMRQRGEQVDPKGIAQAAVQHVAEHIQERDARAVGPFSEAAHKGWQDRMDALKHFEGPDVPSSERPVLSDTQQAEELNRPPRLAPGGRKESRAPVQGPPLPPDEPLKANDFRSALKDFDPSLVRTLEAKVEAGLPVDNLVRKGFGNDRAAYDYAAWLKEQGNAPARPEPLTENRGELPRQAPEENRGSEAANAGESQAPEPPKPAQPVQGAVGVADSPEGAATAGGQPETQAGPAAGEGVPAGGRRVLSGVDRLRATRRLAGTVEAKQQSARTPDAAAREALRRYESGETERGPITEASSKEILDRMEAGEWPTLTDREKQVVQERLSHGTHFRPLGEKLGVSYELARKDEVSARKKMGYHQSFDKLHKAEQPTQAGAQIELPKDEKGHEVTGEQLYVKDPTGQFHNQRAEELSQADKKLDALFKTLHEEEKSGKLTPERAGDLRDAIEGHRRAIEALQDRAGSGARQPEEVAGAQGEAAPGSESELAGQVEKAFGPHSRFWREATPLQKKNIVKHVQDMLKSRVMPDVQSAVEWMHTDGGVDAESYLREYAQPDDFKSEQSELALPEGMGAASGAQTDPAAPSSAPKASAPPAPPSEAAPTTSWFRKAGDFLRTFAQKQFPAVTRLSRPVGEKLAQSANAKSAAHASWDYFSSLLKIEGKRLADIKEGSPEDRRYMAAFLERRLREYRAKLQAEKDPAADKVRTLVGADNSPLQSETDYQNARDELWGFWEGYKQEFAKEVDANYRGLKDIPEDEATNTPSQIPGLPIHATALTGDEPGAVKLKPAGQARGYAGQKLRNPGFTRKAELSAPAYDLSLVRGMKHMLDFGIPAARRAEFARDAIADGVIFKTGGKPPEGSYQAEQNGKYIARTDQPAPPGWKYKDAGLPDGWAHLEPAGPPPGFVDIGLRPNSELPGLDRNASYYAHPEAVDEIADGLGFHKRLGQRVGELTKPVMNAIYATALASPVELATHTANHVTAMFRPGMGLPPIAAVKAISNSIRAWQHEPEMMRQAMGLAKIGASFTHEAKPGLGHSIVGMVGHFAGAAPEKIASAQERVSRYDPTAIANRWTSRFIHAMQTGVRVQLGEAYDALARAKKFPEGETFKRDSINQALGNYNANASNFVTQFLKDTGLQGFATAAHTFTVQGVKTSLGGAINAPATSRKAGLELRAKAIAKILAVAAIGPAWNLLRWGQAFPENVPAFALKTREDDEGKVHHFDPLAFTGLRRGWRATGQSALIEKLVHGGNSNYLDTAARDLGHTVEHLAIGPPGQFVHTALTGENAMGRKVAEQVSTAKTYAGAARAARRGAPPPGSSQTVENLKAAFKGVNPIVAGLTEKNKSPRTVLENVMQSAGPFGEKTRDKKKKHHAGQIR